jgi:phage anti-repressor protein
MNELIKIETQIISGDEVQTCNARDLWEFVESKQDFSDWIKNRLQRYNFVEGEDYLLHKFVEQLPSGAKQKIDYHLTIDAAKEMTMVENNEKGRKIRKYFIECERRLKRISAEPSSLITSAGSLDLSNPSQVLKFALDLIERNLQEEEVREALRITEKRIQIPQPLGDRGVMVLGSTCFVPLNEEFRAIVDRSDLGRVLDHTWRVNLSDAVCKVEREDLDLGKRKRDTLQEFIYQYQGRSNGLKVTHANHNGLDNRAENLVLLTRAQIRARDDLFFGRFIQPSLKTNGTPVVKDSYLIPILRDIYSKLEQELILSLQSNL